MSMKSFFATKKGKITLAVTVLLVAVTGMAFSRRSKAIQAPVPPSAARVEVVAAAVRPLLLQGFESNSTLEAPEDVTLTPKVAGRLLQVKVKTGQQVRKGQVLAVLDRRDQDAQVGALSAQVEVSRAGVAQARAELDSALRERDRYTRLLKEGYATKQELDSRETAYQSALAAYDRARASVSQAQANLQAQSVNRSEFTLVAPIDGVVLDDFSLTPGTLLSTATPVVRIANVDRVKAVLQVPEVQASAVAVGMKARITAESLAGEAVEGRVSVVRPYVDPSTRTVQVEVSVDNKALGYRLKPGMFARVFLVEKTAENALVVPADSIVDGKLFLVRDGKAVQASVRTGLILPDVVQVVSGVSSGDLVVVSGGSALKNGDPVQAEGSASN
jgi:membrane fusion protein (multidrug efflux system)